MVIVEHVHATLFGVFLPLQFVLYLFFRVTLLTLVFIMVQK